jgi:hypothetical protein
MNQAVRPKQKTSATAGETAIDPYGAFATGGYEAFRLSRRNYFLLRLLMSGFDIVYQKSAASMAKRTEHTAVMKNAEPTVRVCSEDIFRTNIAESGAAQIS